jgi:phosphoglycolate phosphatase
MLVLFDVDATLIATSGVGVRSLEDAGRELFGEGFALNGVEYAGRLDPLIMGDLLALNGVERSAAQLARLRATYKAHLVRRLADWPQKLSLPGVMELLGALSRHEHVAMGLLTGNFEETGRIKLSACGIDADRFPIRVWGDDSPHVPPSREHLPPVAMRRYTERYKREVPAHKVTVIGDTPHDIGCARVNGCRSIGVGTGHFTAAELRASGADLAVDDLSGTDALVAWLTS